MVSTTRFTWTRENVAFANACFNGNGRDMTQCPVTLAFQNYTDQQDNTAQARINDGLQLEETLAWFLPHRHGDHDVKFGGQYQFTNAWNTNQGNMNGTFSFGRSDAAFNAAIASTYPDRFSIRVGGPSTFTEKAHYLAFFGQDKWRVQRPHHREPRLALRPRDPADPRDRRSARDDLSKGHEQPGAADWRDLHARQAGRDPRRVRAVLRKDALRGDRWAVHRHAVHDVVHLDEPDLRAPTSGRATGTSRPISSSSTAR